MRIVINAVVIISIIECEVDSKNKFQIPRFGLPSDHVRVEDYVIQNLMTLGNLFARQEVCNPIECFSLLNSMFQVDVNENACKKINKVEKCVSLCSPTNNYIFRGIESVKQFLCDENFNNQLADPCVDKHKYQFLSCLYEKHNLKTVESSADEKLLMCRKISEAEHCDNDLIPCSLHSNYIASVLLEKFYLPLRKEFCLYTVDQVYNLEVKSAAQSKGFTDLAKCLDRHSSSVTLCIPGKWVVTNSPVHAHFGNKLCRAVESFFICIQDIVKNSCDDLQDASEDVVKLLYTYLVPQCASPNKIPVSYKLNESSENIMNQTTYSLNSSASPKNSTELVIIHQHIVVNVVKHDHSSAANLNPVFNVTTLVIFILSTRFSFIKLCNMRLLPE